MQSRPLALMVLLAALGLDAAAQGEPRHRTTPKPETTLGVDYSYANFKGDIDAWHQGAITVTKRGEKGSILGRANLARRFATNGAQMELDLYPALGDGKYAFLTAGYSGSTIFPDRRYGAEYFTALPHGSEGSVGVRNLRFPTEQVTLFTGSVGRITDNYSFSLRPYVREKSGDFTASVTLAARRYYADADTYIGARFASGSAPTETLHPSQLGRKHLMAVSLHASRPGSARAVTTWMLNYERNQYPSQTLKRLEFGIGLRIRL